MPLPARAARAVVAAAVAAAAVLGPVATVLVATPTSASAATCPPSGGVAVPEAAASGDVVFRGHGWGHGLGMSQYGAQGAARLGCTHQQILSRYYAGTAVTAATMPTSVKVRLLDGGSRIDVKAETGAVTWQWATCGAATCIQPKGSTWRVTLNTGRTAFVVKDVGTGLPMYSGAGSTKRLRLLHSGQVVRVTTYRGSALFLDRRLRWDLTALSIDGAALDAVQVVQDNAAGTGMDKYLWGISEVPIPWTNRSHEALRAQAVAARTYAAKHPGAVLMPTPADQNYLGYTREAEDAGYRDSAGRNYRWRDAVNTTSGQVVKTTGGTLIDTFYTSSMGGWSDDEKYVWGLSASYLKAVDDSRWDAASDSSRRSWANAYTWSQVASRLGFSEISSISVPKRGDPARLAGVKVTGIRSGSLVTTYLEGWDVRQAFGMLSPGFTIVMRTIGGPAATPITGDWDADGDSDLGWWSAGNVALSMNGRWTKRFRFGAAGDVPVVGDWNNDGKDSVGVFRAGRWYLRNALSTGAADAVVAFGTAGDQPVVGSWNGRSTGLGVKRGPAWYLRHTATSGPSEVRLAFGPATGAATAGDWNGDGRDGVGVHAANGWSLRNTLTSGPAEVLFGYGSSTDRTVVGDWNGDGRDTVGVVRGRTFLLRNANSGGSASVSDYFAG